MPQTPEERRQHHTEIHRAYVASHRERICLHAKKYRLKHTKKVREEKAAYYAAHRAEILEKKKIYLAQHHEEISVGKKQYRKNNHDKILERNRKYRANNSLKVKLYAKQYRIDNKEKIKSHNENRRMRNANIAINDLTPQQWEEIKKAYNNRCVYCGRKMRRLTKDHITPVSLDGPHTASNIVPSCQSCNSKKKNGPPLKPIQPLLLTIAPPKKGGV